MTTESLTVRLAAAGLPATDVRPASGGMAAVAGLATLADGREVFVKTMDDAPPGLFAIEAEGLAALAAAAAPGPDGAAHSGPATPAVLHVDEHLLVLEALRPAPDVPAFWEQLALDVAALHTTTVTDTFGWPHEGRLGRMRQDNTPTTDGFAFFAHRRLLRWLPEPRVRAKLDDADVAALHRLCDRLPELLPDAPPCLVHGDFWAANVLATADGRPAVIDPAVSHTWAEIDLAHLWSTPHPPAADAFFATYAQVRGLDVGWRERMPLLQLRQDLALMAMFDDDWGSTATVKAVLAPFRWRSS